MKKFSYICSVKVNKLIKKNQVMRNFFRNLSDRAFLLFDFLRGRDVIFMYYADNRINGSTCLNIRDVRDIPFSLRMLLTEPIGPVDDPIITDIYVRTYHYSH